MLKAIIFIIILTIVNLGALAFVFMEVGSPMEARARAMDSKRIIRLNALKSYVDQYMYTKKLLPNSLDEMKETIYDKSSLIDPESSEAFEYTLINSTSYQLCASFNADSKKGDPSMLYVSQNSPFTTYTKGRYCFTLTGPKYY